MGTDDRKFLCCTNIYFGVIIFSFDTLVDAILTFWLQLLLWEKVMCWHPGFLQKFLVKSLGLMSAVGDIHFEYGNDS